MDPFGEIIERGDARYRGRFEPKQSRFAKVRVVVFGNRWRTVAIICLLIFAAQAAPIPFWDSNATTLVLPTKEKQVEVAKALALVIGNPTATLNTDKLDRYLFSDGTSVDWLKSPKPLEPHEGPYKAVVLKTITIGFFRGFFVSPMDEANKLETQIKSSDQWFVINHRPDNAFKSNDVVLVYAEPLEYKLRHPHGEEVWWHSYGAGILIRRHAFQIEGPAPKPFVGWP